MTCLPTSQHAIAVHKQVTLEFAARGCKSNMVLLSVRRVIRADGSTQTHVRRGDADQTGAPPSAGQQRWEGVTQVGSTFSGAVEAAFTSMRAALSDG
jgi:hypothetical protein